MSYKTELAVLNAEKERALDVLINLTEGMCDEKHSFTNYRSEHARWIEYIRHLEREASRIKPLWLKIWKRFKK